MLDGQKTQGLRNEAGSERESPSESREPPLSGNRHNFRLATCLLWFFGQFAFGLQPILKGIARSITARLVNLIGASRDVVM
jgi:hypothetical protein